MTNITPTSDNKSVSALINPLQKTFASTESHKIPWRLRQLTTLSKLISENESELCHALFQDLGKSETESLLSEVSYIQSEINHAIANIKKWNTPQDLPTPGLLFPASASLVPIPRGVSLVIAPFNFPLQLSLVPVANSLAAGCPTVLKPSELCPAVSTALAALFRKYFSPDAALVVEGGVPETTNLLSYDRWGTILFTGSNRVGRIVAAAAAATNTPVVLELSGASPVYIDECCPDMRVVCDRIVWGKTMNAGQICVAPNHVYCHEARMEEFCRCLKESVQRMFPTNDCSDIGRIVNTDHVRRIVEWIKEAETALPSQNVITGGTTLCNIDERCVFPTILRDPPPTTKLGACEEIFGPVLSVFAVSSEDDAVRRIQNTAGTPLALYVFTTSSRTFDRVIRQCPSGAVVRNDVVVHFAAVSVPVGGCGSSGCGRYHGKFGFDTFTHWRPVVFKPCHLLWEYGGLRYKPHDSFKQRALLALGRLPLVPTATSVKFSFVVFATMAFVLTNPVIKGAFVDILRAIADFLDR